jgi:hypothetical protein
MDIKKPTNTIFSYLSKWPHKEMAFSITIAMFLFMNSLVINYFAGTYASRNASGVVRDIILDNIPTFDVDGIFIYGISVFFVFLAGLLFWKPHNAPFVIKSVSIFIIIRSFFVCLTHIGPVPQAVIIPADSIINLFSFTGDLFFSGHTGLPFLLALIYWKNIYLRFIFFISSLIMGATVLLGHLHYSIDVFSAFFISFAIYHIALWLFKKDYSHLSV